MAPTDFAKALSQYLGVYLPGQRNLSTNTLKSYRDTFKLFLRYCKQDCHLAIEKLCLRQIDKRLILGFLDWLEKDRHNGVSTRNQRLACLHGFYQYLQLEEPAEDLSGLGEQRQRLVLGERERPGHHRLAAGSCQLPALAGAMRGTGHRALGRPLPGPPLRSWLAADIGHRTHRGSRIADRGLLFDGDDRGKAHHKIDVGSFKLRNILLGKSRHRF